MNRGVVVVEMEGEEELVVPVVNPILPVMQGRIRGVVEDILNHSNDNNNTTMGREMSSLECPRTKVPPM
jgi:hypothetical protein